MKIVTGSTGQKHITAADDGGLHQGLLGPGCYVLDVGTRFACTVMSNTQVEIGPGEGVMYGRHFRTPSGYVDGLTLQVGAPNYNRNDIIAAHYKNTGGYESITLVVITGASSTETAKDPSFLEADISAGATESYFPLYRVRLTGQAIAGVDTLYTLVDSTLSNPRPEWGSIKNPPAAFPPEDHAHKPVSLWSGSWNKGDITVPGIEDWKILQIGTSAGYVVALNNSNIQGLGPAMGASLHRTIGVRFSVEGDKCTFVGAHSVTHTGDDAGKLTDTSITSITGLIRKE